MGVKSDAASASVILVPLPPKSSSATTPLAGRRESEFSAVSAATESGTSRGAIPPWTKSAWVFNAACMPRNASEPQCAGTAIVMFEVAASPPASLINASSASTNNSDGSWVEPSADFRGFDPPTRSTKPVISVPVSSASGLSGSHWGRPSSGARSGKRVNTARRETGGLPPRTATKFVVPIDNPSGSYITRILSLAAFVGQR